MIIPRLSDADLAAIRANHPEAVEIDLSEDEIGYPVVLPFTFKTLDRYVGDIMASNALANRNAGRRHILHPSPSDLDALERGSEAGISAKIVGVMCNDAGMFVPTVDELTRNVPPGVLHGAGLDQATANAILDKLPPHRKARIVTVADDSGDTQFACVLATPREADMAPLDKALETKGGERIGQTARAAAIGCVQWCREGADPATVFKSDAQCAVAAFVLVPIMRRMQSEATVGASKRGRRTTR